MKPITGTPAQGRRFFPSVRIATASGFHYNRGVQRFLSLLLSVLVLLSLSLPLLGQEPSEDAKPGVSPPPPRSDVDSSSKDTKVDLAPPPNDQQTHPDSGVADDILEFHPYNPHRAMKNIEVGDYYFKRKNYSAAVSRYREALVWKPNDAEAIFHLARALEKTGDFQEAREDYQQYLKLLPKGPEAAEAEKALQRLSSRGKAEMDGGSSPK